LLLVVLLLYVVKRLATLVRCANCVYEVVKFANSSKLSKELKLIHQSRCSELLFELADSFAVYCSFNDEVYYIARTAYAVARVEVNISVFVKGGDSLIVVARGVVAHKTVKFFGDFVGLKYVNNNRRLGGACVVSIEVAEGNKYCTLLVVCI
jgi:hypothetical protein